MADIPDMPRRRLLDTIPKEKSAIVGANIRTFRQRNGWTQAKLGELMGWQSTSTVCAAEGHRSDRQRGFTTEEVERLSAIFGIPSLQLTTRCANCEGQPPAGFVCLACGATPNGVSPSATMAAGALTDPVRHDHAEARG